MKLGNYGNSFIRVKALLILLVAILIGTFHSAHAFRSFLNSSQYAKLPGAATVMSYYYNQIDSELSITGSGQQITHAINQWDIASWYTIFSQGAGGSPTGNTHQISTPI